MSNVAGMFSGALMTVSLLAVPCVAVFGLPSVGQAVTDPASKGGVSLAEADDLGFSAGPTGGTSEAPAFAPVVDAEPTQAAAPSPPATKHPGQLHLDPTSDRRGAAANMAAGIADSSRVAQPAVEPVGRAAEMPPENVFASTPEESEPAPSVPNRSWTEAAAKLERLGIRDVHMTDGDVPGSFYFSCSIKESGSDVTRRFEAEGPSRVAAAEDVLAQVEQCFATR